MTELTTIILAIIAFFATIIAALITGLLTSPIVYDMYKEWKTTRRNHQDQDYTQNQK